MAQSLHPRSTLADPPPYGASLAKVFFLPPWRQSDHRQATDTSDWIKYTAAGESIVKGRYELIQVTVENQLTHPFVCWADSDARRTPFLSNSRHCVYAWYFVQSLRGQVRAECRLMAVI